MTILYDNWCEATPGDWTAHAGLGSITVGAGFSAGARGTNGYRLLADVAGRNSYVYEIQAFGTIPAGGRYYLGQYFQLKVAPTAVLTAGRITSGANSCLLQVNAARTCYIWHNVAGGDAASTAGAALNIDQWYWIVFGVLRSTADGAPDGAVNMWVNDVLYSSNDGDSDNFTELAAINRIDIGLINNTGGVPDIWVDDARLGDTYPAAPAGGASSMMMKGV